jgi:hypothetical protein
MLDVTGLSGPRGALPFTLKVCHKASWTWLSRIIGSSTSNSLDKKSLPFPFPLEKEHEKKGREEHEELS